MKLRDFFCIGNISHRLTFILRKNLWEFKMSIYLKEMNGFDLFKKRYVRYNFVIFNWKILDD